MSDHNTQITDEIYALAQSLGRHNHETNPAGLLSNGIYFFFEQGETIRWRNATIDRIVRIGTHKKDGRFKKRIRQHYGNVNSLRGNKNGSVFRKHLGGALSRRVNSKDPRLNEWLKQGGRSYLEVEELVSRRLRESFTYCCFRVDSPEERNVLERGLIALIAQHPIGRPSAKWLGKHAASEKIVQSGLWNTQHITASPLTSEQLRRIEELAVGTKGEQ
jgi:hypothetical protein